MISARTSALSMVLLASMGISGVLTAAQAGAAPAQRPGSITIQPARQSQYVGARITVQNKLARVLMQIDGHKVQPSVQQQPKRTYLVRYAAASIVPGQHKVVLKVWDQRGYAAQTRWNFSRPSNPALSVDRQVIRVGERVHLSGQGYVPGKTIQISLGGPNTGASGNYGSATVDSSGRFAVDVLLGQYPDGSPLAAGSIVLVAHTLDFKDRASIQVQVVSPSLRVDRAVIHAGDRVRLTGGGFASGTSITIGMGTANSGAGGNYGQVTADSNGAFTLDVTVDRYPDGSALRPGAITLVAHNPDGSQKAGVDLRVLAEPALSVDRTTVQRNDRVHLTGQGFTPGTQITVSLGGLNTGAGGNYGSAVVDGNGAFTLDATLDRYPDGSPLQAGTVVLLAHNADGSEKASAQVQVQIPLNPRVSLDKTVIRSGGTVLLTGDGFPGNAAVSVSLGGVSTGAGGNYGATTTDGYGHFQVPVTLARYPDGTPLRPGTVVLVAHTSDYSVTANVQLQIAPDPTLSGVNATVRRGDSTVLYGSGFTPNQIVTIGLAVNNGPAFGNYGQVLVANDGTIRVTVTLDRLPDGTPLPDGVVTLVAQAQNGERAQTQIRVVVPPARLAASASTVRVGDRITLSGSGFPAYSTVLIDLNSANYGTTGRYGATTTDGQGQFSLPVTLAKFPDGSPLTPGIVMLTAHTPNVSASASVQITVQAAPAPGITVDRGTIQAGDTVLVAGQNFLPGTQVVLGMGGVNTGASGNYGTATVRLDGTFSFTARLDRTPDGAPLHAGMIMLVAHTSDFAQVARAQVQVVTLTADKAAAEPGEAVKLAGDGFAPNTAIVISMARPNTVAAGNYGTVVTDSRGHFEITVQPRTYPDGTPLRAGPVTLVAHNLAGTQHASVPLSIVYYMG